MPADGSALSRPRRHLPLALSAVALLVACTGVTPSEAARSVKRALFAKDAGAVNGIKASRAPKPGHLVPLDASGRFPAAVIGQPSGARGPRGPEGPPGASGPAGERGPSNVLAAVKDTPVYAATAANTWVDVLTLDKVPAGDYWAIASTNAIYTGSGTNFFRCEINVNGHAIGTNVAVSMGFGAGGAIGATLVHQDAVRLTGAGTVKLRCGHENQLDAADGRFERSRLTLIRSGSIEVTK